MNLAEQEVENTKKMVEKEIAPFKKAAEEVSEKPEKKEETQEEESEETEEDD